MKLQNIAVIFFLLAFPFFMQAQNQPIRTGSPQDQLAVQRGEIESLKTHLYRFNLALEENELPSIDVLKTVLLDAMRQEISQVENMQKKQPLSARKTRLERQQKLAKSLYETTFSGDEKSLEKAALFNEFVLLMEQEYADLEAALK